MPYSAPNSGLPDTSGARNMWMALIGGMMNDAMKNTNSGYTPANTGGAAPDYSNMLTSDIYKPAAWVANPIEASRPFDYATWNIPETMKYTKAGGYKATPPAATKQGSYY